MVLLAAALFFVVFRSGGWVEGIGGALGWIGGVTAGISVLAGVSVAVARALLWRSPAGARLFQRTENNPMEYVARHATWIRRQLKGRPLLIVIDDLDRCDADYVVVLLEAMQTLMRRTDISEAIWAADLKREPTNAAAGAAAAAAAPDSSGRGGRRRPRPVEAIRLRWQAQHPLSSVVYVVAADAIWLRAAFERVYKDFSEPVGEVGRPLGHLFTAKIFQLHLRLPDVEPERVARFSRHVLKLADAPPTVGGAADAAADTHDRTDAAHQIGEEGLPNADPRREFDRDDVERRLADAEGVEAKASVVRGVQRAGGSEKDVQELQESFARDVAAPLEQQAISHRLEPFFGLLDPNPRSIVRFVNAMSVELVINSVREHEAEFEEMARWTLIQQRWPVVAEQLRTDPDLATALGTATAAADGGDAALAQLLRSAQLAAAVRGRGLRPLTPDTVRICCGLAPVDGRFDDGDPEE
jgi:KAP family P-loop domain